MGQGGVYLGFTPFEELFLSGCENGWEVVQWGRV
jgi:hypothetical protein